MPSFLQYLDELSKRGAITPQPWGDVSGSKSVSDVYADAAESALRVQKKFLNLLHGAKRVVKKPEFKARIKTMKSFVDKAYERGTVKSTSSMTDILAGAVLVNTDKDAEKAAKWIAKHGKLLEFEVLDKFGRTTTTFSSSKDRKGTTVFKKYGEDEAAYGYHGSYHILLKFGDVITELQVMTKRLWHYKEKGGHPIYNKWRSVNDLDSFTPEAHMKRVDQALSKKIYRVANSEPSRIKIKGARDHKKRY